MTIGASVSITQVALAATKINAVGVNGNTGVNWGEIISPNRDVADFFATTASNLTLAFDGTGGLAFPNIDTGIARIADADALSATSGYSGFLLATLTLPDLAQSGCDTNNGPSVFRRRQTSSITAATRWIVN